MSTKLIALFADCFMATADPDGGYEYALKFARETVDNMCKTDITDTLDNIANGEEVIYDPDFGWFFTAFPEED